MSRGAQPGAWRAQGDKGLEAVAAPALAPPSAAHAAHPSHPTGHKKQMRQHQLLELSTDAGVAAPAVPTAARPTGATPAGTELGRPAGSPSGIGVVTGHLDATARKRASAPLLALQPSLRRARPA